MLPAHLQETFRQAFAHHTAGRLDVAARMYRDLLAAAPQDADVLQLLGTVSLQTGDYGDAIERLQASLNIQPAQPAVRQNLAQAWMAHGVAQQNTEQLDSARDSYAKALALNPSLVEAINNIGVILLKSGQVEDALTQFQRAAAINPNFADAVVNIATALKALQRYGEAIPAFRRALTLKPDSPFLKGASLHTKQHVCEWKNLDEDFRDLLDDVDAGKMAATPLTLMATPATPAQILKGTTTFAAARYAPSSQPLWRGERYKHDKIRIGYFSPDFYDHATSRLFAGVLEAHDRTRFDLRGYTWGPSPPSPMRERVNAAFGGLVDINSMSDRAAAQLARQHELDVVVDISGFTEISRPGLFSHRPAPVQVSYLALPGSMGTPYHDYMIADRVVVPPEHHAFYREKIVTLPDTYQCNDDQRIASERVFTRDELGLPESGFVFASFNNSFKITPEAFDIWMRLLRDVPGSVLWLLDVGALAKENLKREAEARGVTADRLVFVPRASAADHLARHVHADLFLDTLVYNGHTTTSDALWTGGVVVACEGGAFAGRVSASLLTALGVPELTAPNPEAYARLALALARDPARLSAVKAKIAAHRRTFPLFNTARFTRHLEAAFTEMHGRSQRGEPPAAFAISPLSS